MKTTAAEILSAFAPQGIVKEMVGPDQPVQRIAPIEDCGPGDLVFVDKPKFVALVTQRRPAVVVTSFKLKDLLADGGDRTLLLAPNVNLAQALIKQRYAGRQFEAAGWPQIHPSAVVHETAMLAATAVVEPRAVIGRNVRLGERTRIMAGAVVEHDAQVGSDTVVHPNAVIGYGCVVGNEAVIGAGSVIGSEGYGFAQDQQGRSHPIPQTGNVVLGDRVRLGANCCIDRAAYRTTRIGAGTKLDNLCHIAHNVEIGEDCLLTSMFCVAGSTTIGNRVIASGQSGVSDHVKICDDVVLLHRAGVVADIDQPGAYAALPVQPLKEYMRNTAVFRMLAELRQRLLALERRDGGSAAG
jgi:UDP-3-O-[3-hydroxymyristoyl] glucosamine N-acyltransferase